MCGAVVLRLGEAAGIMELLELLFEKKNRAKKMYSWLQKNKKNSLRLERSTYHWFWNRALNIGRDVRMMGNVQRMSVSVCVCKVDTPPRCSCRWTELRGLQWEEKESVSIQRVRRPAVTLAYRR